MGVVKIDEDIQNIFQSPVIRMRTIAEYALVVFKNMLWVGNGQCGVVDYYTYIQIYILFHRLICGLLVPEDRFILIGKH